MTVEDDIRYFNDRLLSALQIPKDLLERKFKVEEIDPDDDDHRGQVYNPIDEKWTWGL
jgi:hypothetical protein